MIYDFEGSANDWLVCKGGRILVQARFSRSLKDRLVWHSLFCRTRLTFGSLNFEVNS